MEGSRIDHEDRLLLFNEDDDDSRNCGSSSDLMEDASSSSTTTPCLSDGPLYGLSELMSHLPIKRGLSKYYEGKSQSFRSLASVKSKEELVKRDMKSSNKYNHKNKSHPHTPKPTIAKKVSTLSYFSSSALLPNFRSPIQKCSHLA